jgi:NADPH2:quinone reductase
MPKAFRLYAHGGPDVMKWEDVDVPDPGPGQIRVRHTAVAVNYRDVLIRNGIHEVKLPSGLGLEAAGVICDVGADATGFAVGDRIVCVAGPDGAYAEERLVPAARAIKLPGGISDRQAASMMIRGMTARYLVRETYRVTAGSKILVHAAAGGVGTILCQWAKHLGATVIGAVGSREKVAAARRNGCDHVVISEADFSHEVKQLTNGDGVDAIYDSIGKATFEFSARSLRRRGLLISFGEVSGDPDPVPPRRLGQLGSIYLTHPSLPDYTATREELVTAAQELFDMISSGQIRADIVGEYALRDAPLAHADIESRKTTGAVVLIP